MNEISYKDLNAELLRDFFPEYKNLICDIDIESGGGVPHFLYWNFFNPLIKSTLRKLTDTNAATAKKIFEFYERLASSGDDNVDHKRAMLLRTDSYVR